MTNHFDIDIISQLVQTVQINQPTMLAVDYNEIFVRQVTTKTLSLEKF